MEKEREAASSLLKAAKAAGAARLEEEKKAEAIRCDPIIQCIVVFMLGLGVRNEALLYCCRKMCLGT